MTKIFLDLDEVLADFVGAAIEFHGEKFRAEEYKKVVGPEAWYMDRWFDGDPESFWNPFSREFYANLPKMEGGDTIVERSIELAGPDNVCILTSMIKTPGCSDGKRDWISKHYPDIPAFLCHRGKSVPKHFCSGGGRILIDDHDENIISWVRHGGVGILCPRRWNTLHFYESISTHYVCNRLDGYFYY